MVRWVSVYAFIAYRVWSDLMERLLGMGGKIGRVCVCVCLGIEMLLKFCWLVYMSLKLIDWEGWCRMMLQCIYLAATTIASGC